MLNRSSRSLVAATLLLMATGILLLGLGGFLDPLQGLALRPLGSIQSWIAVRYAALRDMITAPTDLEALRLRNAELEAEVARLRQQVVSLQEEVASAQVLSALVNYARTQPENRYLAADVIGRDISPFIRSIWINSGSDAGIGKGMPVVTERGLVGRVVEVYATVSRVQLITDPEGAVNVKMQRSRAEGVLAAQLNGDLWVDFIDQDAAIEEEELVLTSGLGGNYPPEIPIGTIAAIRKRDFDLFQQAVVEPSTDFDNLEIVLVITSFQPLPVGESSP
jgi:rod shape-determining protein MreC